LDDVNPKQAAPQAEPLAQPGPTHATDPPPGSTSRGVDLSSDPELRAYIRRNLIRAGVVLLLAIVGLGLTGLWFEEELIATCSWVLDRVGLAGIAAILYVSDAFCAPIPSDLTLVVIAKSDLSPYWPIIVPALALWSSFAGATAWLLGTKVGRLPWATRLLGRLQSGQNHALVARLGKWGVALGALTPIPYSLTCWTAGMLELTLREIFWVNLLRLPRFLAYYLAFAHSDDLMRLLG
jgi:membrane protein YqaA with SNARE-associated domain